MNAAFEPTGAPLKKSPLHDLHVALGARMTPFAGYDMPLHYAAGVLKEHLHTRAAAGVFDVSHMGQIVLRAKSGDVVDVARALERMLPIDALGLADGRQRYGFFTDENGGILDDLMVARLSDRFLIVCNAACKTDDEAHLRAHLSDVCEIEPLDRALIALQGPRSAEALARLAPDVLAMRFMDAREIEIMLSPCFVTRSGYTGEDGFEISIPTESARDIAEALLAIEGVAPIGLGARDSLRLEAGLCLYGADIDETTTPVESGLSWAIPKIRRRGGARAGGFPGAEAILSQIEKGASRARVGLRPDGRAPLRAGAPLFASQVGGPPIGQVTSGGFGPSVEAPVAMGYVPTTLATPGMRVFAELRGKSLAATIVRLPFVKHRYNHGSAE